MRMKKVVPEKYSWLSISMAYAFTDPTNSFSTGKYWETKFQEVSKSKTCICCALATIYIYFLHCIYHVLTFYSVRISSAQLLSRVQLFVTPWTAVHQASLYITNSQSLLKLMSIELVMPSNHLILCRPLLLLPSIFPSIWVFSNESVLHIRWPKYWSFSFSISLSNEYSALISFRMDWLDLLAVQGTLKSLL